jgi:hypothetical protein
MIAYPRRCFARYTPRMAGTQYRNKRAIGSVEQRFSIEGDELLVARADAGGARVPLASIREIRLHYQPNRYEGDVYECTVEAPGGVWRIFSRYVAGVLDFRDQAEEYRAFVAELCARRARLQPPCRFAAGVSPGRYAGNALAVAGGMGLLLLALVFLPLANYLFIGLRLAVIIPLLILTVLWFVKNRPGGFDPAAIPATLLPRAGAEPAPPLSRR